MSLLLSNPKQVQRKDGKPVPRLPDSGFWREAWLTILELKDPRVFAMAFLWSQSLFVRWRPFSSSFEHRPFLEHRLPNRLHGWVFSSRAML